MLEWWNALTTANQMFFGIAAFFSVLFVWQFIMTLIGLAGHEADFEAEAADADLAADVDAADAADAGEFDAADTAMSFRLLSFRSVITGGLMFGWAGSLYLYSGVPLEPALLYAISWAVAGALIIAVLLYFMRRLQETGTPRLATCLGKPATVYMDIPKDGAGRIRTVVSGALSFVAARGAGGKAIRAGTPVRVRRLLDTHTVEVDTVPDDTKETPDA